MVQISLEQKVPTLKKPPLLEAIFELRWELQGDPQSGRMRDPAYPMMYGRLYERLKEEFPLIEDLPSVQAHPEAAPYVVRHRMRKDRSSYPLVQVGPGILTVNDAKGYGWANFKPLISRLIDAIFDLYPKEGTPINFVKAELRYVNGVQPDPGNPINFLAQKLHLHVDSPIEGAPVGVGINLAYPLNKPTGHLLLSANLGGMDGQPAFIVQTVVQSGGETVPQEVLGFEGWLKSAHDSARDAFYSVFKGALMKGFEG
jgi:uncharacterized protein (TIGR04255 family)